MEELGDVDAASWFQIANKPILIARKFDAEYLQLDYEPLHRMFYKLSQKNLTTVSQIQPSHLLRKTLKEFISRQQTDMEIDEQILELQIKKAFLKNQEYLRSKELDSPRRYIAKTPGPSFGNKKCKEILLNDVREKSLEINQS